MADQNVRKVQHYLNTMFGGNSNWAVLEENGRTGSAVMEGIIKAFQIYNQVSGVTGTVGPATIQKMKSLPVIRKMTPDDTPDINVCLIQCALFCKGYAAGGITGIYYNAGVSAVKKMQQDAGLDVTGEVDWKVWAGLLSLNWFALATKGDTNVQIIQRQLNRDWSDIIGVGPCDGIVSRQTALSLVAALQGAEGVTTSLLTSLNGVNFGDATTKAFPGVLKVGKNGANDIKFNKLVQYGLYFNGYDTKGFDGIYDQKTRNCVADFQKFYGLLGTTAIKPGEVDVSTMKSLLTSKGDTSRSAKACDTATILGRQQARNLRAQGFEYVGRYLTGYVGKEHQPKALTHDEVEAIQAADLSVFPIYQDGGYYLDYFKNAAQGCEDALNAISAAKQIGIPHGVRIYFAVDFDCYGDQIENYIIPYFAQINAAFYGSVNDKKYKVGIYAPRHVCSMVSKRGYASASFVSDMSSGFTGNLGYAIPKNWAFDQFATTKMTLAPMFELDKDGFSGIDCGFKKFDSVPKLSDEELRDENRKRKIEISKEQFAYNVLYPLGFYEKIANAGFAVNKEIQLLEYEDVSAKIELSTEIEVLAEDTSNGEKVIHVKFDSSGKMEESCENEIAGIAAEAEEAGKRLGLVGADQVKPLLTKIAVSVKSGNIAVSIKISRENYLEFKVTVNSDDILSTEKAKAIVSIALICRISIKPKSQYRFSLENVDWKVAFIGTVAAVLLVAFFGSGVLTPVSLSVIVPSVVQKVLP